VPDQESISEIATIGIQPGNFMQVFPMTSVSNWACKVVPVIYSKVLNLFTAYIPISSEKNNKMCVWTHIHRSTMQAE